MTITQNDIRRFLQWRLTNRRPGWLTWVPSKGLRVYPKLRTVERLGYVPLCRIDGGRLAYMGAVKALRRAGVRIVPCQ